jgi:hypothetical protein
MDRVQYVERIARAKALVAKARVTIAAARNHRHTATLRRALDQLTRTPRADQFPTLKA